MKNRSLLPVLLLLTILLGCLFALPQLVERGRVEAEQKQVELDMSWQDIQRLADSSGEPVAHWLTGLRDAGLYRVLFTDEELADPAQTAPAQAAGLETAQVGGIPQGGSYLFAALYDEKSIPGKREGLLYEPETLPQSQVMDALAASGATLFLVENEPQTGDILPEGWTLTQWEVPTVKCTWLTNYQRARYQVLGYPGAEEIVNICYRSVVDRGMTALWMSPFLTQDKEMVDDLAVYEEAFGQLEARLAPGGYTFGEATPLPDLSLSPLSLVMLGIGVISLAVFLVGVIFSVRRMWILAVLFLLGAGESLAGALMAPELQRTVLALLSALVFPAAAVVLLGRRLGEAEKKPARFPVGRYLVTALFTVACALAGGLYVGAILGTADYMMILRLFRGVKLSQMAVYLFAILWLGWALLHLPGNRPAADCRALVEENRRHWKGKLLLVVLLVVAVCAIYLLRSGDGMVSIADWEIRLRDSLESILFYRPRTKEFLVAWPALALACLCAVRGKRLFAWLFGVLASVGYASVVNTFCHIRAHVVVSLARTGLGLLIGVLLGMAALVILGALWRGERP